MSSSNTAVAKPFSFEGWEDAEFPIACENCLGDAPAIRMVKATCDKECKICARPCTAFRWKPGGNKARYKSTIICQLCAKQKNVCQVCLFDLQFGLPVQVRDRFLEGPGAVGKGGTSHELSIPVSRVNRDYMVNKLEKGTDIEAGYDKIVSKIDPTLKHIARTQPYYKRNEARVCTFWLKNQCNRGNSCPFRHEADHHDPELSNQRIKSRYHGINDPVANKILQKLECSGETPKKEEESSQPATTNASTTTTGTAAASTNNNLQSV